MTYDVGFCFFELRYLTSSVKSSFTNVKGRRRENSTRIAEICFFIYFVVKEN